MADTTNDKAPEQNAAPPATEPSQADALAAMRAEIEALKAQLANPAQAVQLAQAQARKQAEEEKLTETIPGGLYLASDGKTLVNAYGRKVDKKGKPLSDDDRYLESAVPVIR